MHVKVVYAHPYDGSYNRAILEAVLAGLKSAGHSTDLLDINRDGFNPVMTEGDLLASVRQQPTDPKVLEYQSRIEAAQHLVFIFPIWFESVPAILKGYLDKVFSNGWAYKTIEGKKMPVGQLTHLDATVISTMGVSRMVYRLFLNNAVEGVLIKGCLKFSGVKRVKWFKLDQVPTTSAERRKTWLAEIQRYMLQLT